MGYCIHETNVVAERNSLQFILRLDQSNSSTSATCLSKEYKVSLDGGDAVLFQIMFKTHAKNCERNIHLFIKFCNHDLNDKQIYALEFDIININNNKEGEHVHKNLTTDDGTWRLVKEICMTHTIALSLKFSLKITVPPCCKRITQCASLHEDTDLTDFELRGMDGSVHLHKTIAAAASPVLRRMFTGAWRETVEGVAEVPDTTKATLQHFKDYIYLDKIPDSGVEQLLLLAKCYMMEDLEQRCVDKLEKNVAANTAHHLISFAINHHSDKLLIGILRQLKKSSFNLDKMETFLKTNMKAQASSPQNVPRSLGNNRKRKKCSSK